MATVRLRQPLKRLAGDQADHELAGATVGELLAALERAHPARRRLDPRRARRDAAPHQRVRQRRARRAGDPRRRRRPGRRPSRDLRRLHVTELLVGTKKGLFVLDGEPGGGFEVTARAFAGEPVEYALRDPRSGVLLAAVSSPFYGPKVFFTDDPAGEWDQAKGDRAARGRRAGARADLDPPPRRGGRPGVRRRRSRRPVREPRRRRHVRAQPRPVGAPDAAEVAARRRRSVPALDRDLARRPRPAGDRDLGRRRVAERRRRRELAQGQRGAEAALPARGHAGGRGRPVRAPAAPPPAAARADLHAVPRRRLSLRRRRRELAATSRPGCRPTSASRSPSTPPTPTARS